MTARIAFFFRFNFAGQRAIIPKLLKTIHGFVNAAEHILHQNGLEKDGLVNYPKVYRTVIYVCGNADNGGFINMKNLDVNFSFAD
jgi:hypothetical protein